MRECLETAKRHCNVQMFGTDLDNDAIEAARNGRYPEGIASDVSPQRLERYFTRDDSTYRIRKDIREMAVFAVQNLIKDPPFTKLDLISCRNLLIYLNAELQHRLVPLLHYALKPGGLLFLGSSETIGGFGDLFEVVDKKWKIFRRKAGGLGRIRQWRFRCSPRRGAGSARAARRFAPARESQHRRSARTDCCSRASLPPAWSSASAATWSIFTAAPARISSPPLASPGSTSLDMAREGLQHDLAAALRRAAAQDTEVTREGVRVRSNGDFSYVNLSVTKLHEPEACAAYCW